MKHLKQCSFYAGFFIAIGASPYLAYGFLKMAQGQASPFYLLLLLSSLCFFCWAVNWVLGLKGPAYARVKPFWERPLALLLLLIFSPLILVCAILIKLESDGPIIYLQKRVARNKRRGDRRENSIPTASKNGSNRRKMERRKKDLGGRIFEIYKLRSMRADSEALTGAAWSSGDADPRVTRIGYYIRKTHIDELPQLFNVFRGQMSIIGPRPERPAFIAELREIIGGYQERLTVPAGITGLAQVCQEHDETIEDVKKKLQYDKQYIESMSLSVDLKIILFTARLVARLILNSRRRRVHPQAQPKAVSSLIARGIDIQESWNTLLAKEKPHI